MRHSTIERFVRRCIIACLKGYALHGQATEDGRLYRLEVIIR
jgi:hypothetical protein